MVVAGAGGLAKEILEILAEGGLPGDVYFFDDVTPKIPSMLLGRFSILRTLDEVADYFRTSEDRRFVLGLGSPGKREKLATRLESAGGTLTSVISTDSKVGSFEVKIGAGCCILPGAVITSHVNIGRGVLINPHVSVSHDCTIGDFVELGPGARITGGCVVGSHTVVGTNACVLPKVRIGQGAVIAAGAVVRDDVMGGTLVAGVPAVFKKHL